MSYPLNFFTTVLPSTVIHRFIKVQATSESIFTLASQTYSYAGKRLEFNLQYPPMSHANANAFIAWLLKLDGMVGTFYFSDPDPLLGTGLGSPVVAAGGFASDMKSVATSGWTASKTGVLLPGDWISFSNHELKRVTDQVDSDGSGNATIYFEHPQRTAVSTGTAIALGTNAKGIFKLSDSNIEYSSDVLRHGRFSIAIKEDIS